MTTHKKLEAWVNETAALCQPERVVWCDGSDAEYQRLIGELMAAGTLTKLNPKLRPDSYLAPQSLNLQERYLLRHALEATGRLQGLVHASFGSVFF